MQQDWLRVEVEVSELLVSTNESVEAGNVLIFSDYDQSGEMDYRDRKSRPKY